jgi:uncharacterized protein
MNNSATADKRRLLSTLSHVAIFFSASFISIGVPLWVLFVSDDEVVKANAKESINFHLTAWIVGAIAGILLFIPSFLTLGLIAWIAAGLGFGWVVLMTVLAVLHAWTKPDEPYRYPWVFHIL